MGNRKELDMDEKKEKKQLPIPQEGTEQREKTDKKENSDEGKNLCAEADVKPDDLLIKNYNDFE